MRQRSQNRDAVRICSLLPSATEIVYALGLGDELVAVTHECDFPAQAAAKPRVTRTEIGADRSSRDIDALVRQHMHEHRGIYHLDRDLLERLNPDLILTQELCDVCAVSYEEVQAAVRAIFGERTILSLEPTRLSEVLDTIHRVGEATGRTAEAHNVTSDLQAEIDAIVVAVASVAVHPRVACLEWLDPPWSGGHWVPEMVHLAGGHAGLSEVGSPSSPVSWEQVLAYCPDIVMLMPCGFDAQRAESEFGRIQLPRGWEDLPAVRNGEVYALHANAYFSRPGPRLVTGLRLLGHIMHPDRITLAEDPNMWRRVPSRA